MLTITTDSTRQGTAVLRLNGQATIDNAAQLREALLNGLIEHDHVQIDSAEVTRFDFFAIQMLCSAHRTSVTRKKLLTWCDGKPPLIVEAVEKSGFTRLHGCALCPSGVECLWV